MSAVAFDTLKFVEKLEAGGFSPAQAKAATSAFAEATAERLVTRQGLREETAPITTALAALKSDLRQVELRLSGEMTLLKWMPGLVIAGILALVLKAYFPH